MDFRYNVTLLVISNEIIELSDFINRVHTNTDMKINLPVEEVRLSASQGLNWLRPNVGLLLPKFLLGIDLQIFNVAYSETSRGVFQVQAGGVDKIETSKTWFKALVDFSQTLGYKNIFAYEVGINFVIEHKQYPKFELLSNLITLASPTYRSLKLQSGIVDKRDLREEYISEINVDMLINEPWKSVVSTVHRLKDFNINIIDDIFQDIESVTGLVR